MTNETFWGLSATAWTAIYTLLTAGLLLTAVAAALYAARQVLISREQAVETRRAQNEASRPYVIVTIEPSQASQQLFDLVVRNIGRRPALGVAITLDPPPVRAEETDGHEISKMRMLNEPVAMIAPDQETRVFFDNAVDRRGREDLPSVHRVTLRYEDSSGHSYDESTVLDLEAMKGAMFTRVKTVHDIGKTLAKMQETLGKASVLGSHGVVDVEASVEPYAAQSERRAREETEQRARSVELIHAFTPHTELPFEPARATDSKPKDNSVKRANVLVRRAIGSIRTRGPWGARDQRPPR